ncbi:MAG: cell envelope integrity protein CreD [Sphingomonadaceae bacterium]|nr:cell envelope integrity protein CreD [Sphingomonadaceae bacterium]
MARQSSPGIKLLFVILIGLALSVPLLTVYALVYDRQSQSETARANIAAGWGGPQMMVGPVLALPYVREEQQNVEVNGRSESRVVRVDDILFLSPMRNQLNSRVVPQLLRKSIYESVLYQVENQGSAHFALPPDFERYGVPISAIDFSRAEIRFGLADPRGLQANASVRVNGNLVPLLPGKGLAATNGSGFFSFVDWANRAPMDVTYQFSARGNDRLTFVPRGQDSRWQVQSTWPSPNFSGSFLPNQRRINGDGFRADYAISNLALGQAIVLTQDARPPMDVDRYVETAAAGEGASSQSASVAMVEVVDLYDQVNRAVKYGFLFIGFTFMAFLMFDIIAKARVAAAEYLLVGAALALFFVLLLALAEVIGFTPAYLAASGAIITLITTYSAAVLKSWQRARIIAGLLTALYAALYVLLNLEAYSLLIGSALLFVALAAVMWATRRIDWSAAGGEDAAAAA